MERVVLNALPNQVRLGLPDHILPSDDSDIVFERSRSTRLTHIPHSTFGDSFVLRHSLSQHPCHLCNPWFFFFLKSDRTAIGLRQ